MWEAARDLALEKPKIPGDVLMRMMGRSGQRGAAPERPFPQIDETLERMLAMMAQVLVVEIFAEGTFDWGDAAALGSRGLGGTEAKRATWCGTSARREPARRVSAHGALRAARAHARTVDGSTIAGRDVVDGFLHRILRAITRDRPREQREDVRASLAAAMTGGGEPEAPARRVRRARIALDAAGAHGLRARARRERARDEFAHAAAPHPARRDAGCALVAALQARPSTGASC